jgi:hypothetical protein
MKPEQMCTVRLMPDADETNEFGMWRDHTSRKLSFKGVLGQDASKIVSVTVPAFNTTSREELNVPAHCRFTNKEDVIQCRLADIRANHPNGVEIYTQYKRKTTHHYWGFVRNDPGVETDETRPQDIRRRFMFVGSIHDGIKSYIMSPRTKYYPTDLEHGCELDISVKLDGKFNNYVPQFAREETSLTEDELRVCEELGYLNLNEYLLAKPTDEQLVAMLEMFEASLGGMAYEPKKWGEFYKPFGVEVSGNNFQVKTPNVQTVKPVVKAEPTVAEEDVPWAEPEAVTPKAVAPKPVIKPVETAPVEDKVETPKGKASAAELLARLKKQAEDKKKAGG